MAQDSRCTAFDPLESLGVREADLQRDILSEFHEQERVTLPNSQTSFDGCGVYALYYSGDHSRYRPISSEHHDESIPIFVGSATPESEECAISPSPKPRLSRRLAEHRWSIDQVESLDISEFRCRTLSLAPVWTEYAESLLLQMYQPWWNRYVTGFGLTESEADTDVDTSVWDGVHPGREWDVSPSGSPDVVWDEYVVPRIEAAKHERTYKDCRNIGQRDIPDGHAPAVEEASLFDFERN